MAFRVSVDDVKLIFETDLKANSVEAFIRAANAIVNDNLTGEGVSTTTLKEIERWLSAHLAAQMDPVAKSEKIGDAQVTYALGMTGSAEGLGLNNTPYGQQVRLLDPTGILAGIGRRPAILETALEVETA